ncbi:MAG: hypothetical protein JF588_13060 [Caulobacterales bacterium]|nr:hypothetical protein [Caulobacterales bacterium]
MAYLILDQMIVARHPGASVGCDRRGRPLASSQAPVHVRIAERHSD